MKKLFFLLCVISIFLPILANNLYTVECPTAGLLSRGEAGIHFKILQNNGIVLGADVGLTDFFQFGLAFGGEEVIGHKEPQWNRVDYKVKLRLINEKLSFPAIAIGIDTQGHGSYHNHEKRYDTLSKGVYLVASKNFSMLGLFGFDVGMNYTLDNVEEGNENFDFFTGMYKTFGEHLVLFGDFSLGLNDRNREMIENGVNISLTSLSRGYLNTGLQLRINDQLSVKLLLHDLLRNRPDTWAFDRSLLIDYRWFF